MDDDEIDRAVSDTEERGRHDDIWAHTDRLQGTAVVTQGDSVRAELTEGLADVKAGVPCTPRTRFQLCSVSKQFAAAAVMLLVESGQLDLGQPVDQWLHQAPAPWRQVTLHHLLSHTAGIPHWREAPGLDPADPMALSQRLEVILATPLLTEPGAAWHYSSPGFLLVAAIVERASGLTYRDFLAERILAPLELSETSIGAAPEGAALGYRRGRMVAPWDLNAMPGTGDLWSTATDLCTFTVALHRGDLVNAGSLRAMCTAHTTLDGDDDDDPRLITNGYGYGMFTGLVAGRPVYYHPGGNPGYQSLACWIPSTAASIVVLVNDEATNVTALLGQLLPAAVGS